MAPARVAVFSVEEYAGDVVTAVSMDGGSVDFDDPTDGPHFEIEATITAGSRKEALEALATKVLNEIADYG